MAVLTIRKAKISEAAMLARLGWQTFFDTFQSENTREDMELFLNQHFTKSALEQELDNPANTYLVACIGNEVVGYVKLSDDGESGTVDGYPAIEISRLYAVKQKIGSGIGSTLMKECIRIAEDRNKKFVWLGVWENNQRAIEFYRRFGFEKYGEHDFMLGNDKQVDWLMRRELDVAKGSESAV